MSRTSLSPSSGSTQLHNEVDRIFPAVEIGISLVIASFSGSMHFSVAIAHHLKSTQGLASLVESMIASRICPAYLIVRSKGHRPAHKNDR